VLAYSALNEGLPHLSSLEKFLGVLRERPHVTAFHLREKVVAFWFLGLLRTGSLVVFALIMRFDVRFSQVIPIGVWGIAVVEFSDFFLSVRGVL